MSGKTDKGPNKATERAGLTVNVNAVKQGLKEVYESRNLLLPSVVKQEGSDGQTSDSKKVEMVAPQFAGCQTASAAVLEQFLRSMLTFCAKFLAKEKSGVKVIGRSALQYVMLASDVHGLHDYFYVAMHHYDSNSTYLNMLPMTRKEIDTIVESVDRDLSLDSEGFNIVCYLLHRCFMNVALVSHQFMLFAKKRQFTSRVVEFSVRNVIPAGQVQDEMLTAIETAMKNNDDNDEAEEEVEKPTPVVETKETKTKGKSTKETSKETKPKDEKKQSTKSSKGTKQIENDDEQVENPEEVEAEEEQPEKKKSTGNTKSATKGSGKAK